MCHSYNQSHTDGDLHSIPLRPPSVSLYNVIFISDAPRLRRTETDSPKCQSPSLSLVSGPISVLGAGSVSKSVTPFDIRQRVLSMAHQRVRVLGRPSRGPPDGPSWRFTEFVSEPVSNPVTQSFSRPATEYLLHIVRPEVCPVFCPIVRPVFCPI